jgi:Zn-dependent M28 family amino/carboxypeptidase
MSKLTILLFAAACSLPGDAPPASINPQIQEIVSQVSAAHIADIEKKLESFGTRNIYSATDDPANGIGAAREWIAAQFRSYSPKLQVSFDKHRLAKQGRAFRNVEIWNVVAILPGTSEPERHVIVSGHYDSIHLVYRKGTHDERELDPQATVSAPAPGVTDDGSGTAAVMELARVMSRHQFRKTIAFITFAAEEYGLFGSGLYAEDAAAKHDIIDGVFNNDIIGSDKTGNGETSNRYVNVYSEEPSDSGSRQLARYMKQMAERYQPGFQVNLVFRHDRFGRGGDHSPFNAAGYPAIRVTTPMEDFSNQHTANAAAIAELAYAPKAPELRTPPTTERRAFASPLSRGTGYDAAMNWQNDNPEADLLGYAVVMRSTTSPQWEKQVFVGNVTSFILPNVNIDELVLGVKAIDKNGNESPVSAYVTTPYQQRKIETY